MKRMNLVNCATYSDFAINHNHNLAVEAMRQIDELRKCLDTDKGETMQMLQHILIMKGFEFDSISENDEKQIFASFSQSESISRESYTCSRSSSASDQSEHAPSPRSADLESRSR